MRKFFKALGRAGFCLAGKSVSLGGIQFIVDSANTARTSALVIKCKDLKRFKRSSGIKSSVLWQDKEAAIIRNPDRRMWDIVVVA